MIGAERKTVRRWLRAGGAPFWRKPQRAGGLAPYHDHLDRRWTEGCRNAAQLWRELVTIGFVGRPGTVRPMLGFKSFRSAAVTLAGIELMHMIRKGQLLPTGEMCPARQFYSLAG